MNPAPDPLAVLRGHSAAVACVTTFGECYLASGSADGMVKVWDMATRRVLCSILAHCADYPAGVLSVTAAMHDDSNPSAEATHLITQGRGGAVRAWDLRELLSLSGGEALSDSAPLQGSNDSVSERQSLSHSPWWCVQTGSFSFCHLSACVTNVVSPTGHSDADAMALFAIPSSEPSLIKLWRIPRKSKASVAMSVDTNAASGRPISEADSGSEAEALVSSSSGTSLQKDSCMVGQVTAPEVSAVEVGMCLCLCLFEPPTQFGSGGDAVAPMRLVAGYESGFVAAWDLRAAVDLGTAGVDHATCGEGSCSDRTNGGCQWASQLLFVTRLLSDAVLCLHVDPVHGLGGVCGGSSTDLVPFSILSSCESSGVDDESGTPSWPVPPTIQTPHMGISDVRVRSDGRIAASAGWDHRVRVFKWPKLKKKRHLKSGSNKDTPECTPLAVLKYHTDTVQGVHFGIWQGKHLLVSCSADKQIALWDIYSS